MAELGVEPEPETLAPLGQIQRAPPQARAASAKPTAPAQATAPHGSSWHQLARPGRITLAAVAARDECIWTCIYTGRTLHSMAEQRRIVHEVAADLERQLR